MIGSYKDITHETHTIIFTNSRKRASGFTPGVFQGMYFEVFISFVHCFGIIIKEKCSPFNQGIIQQPIMYINKVITPMTELSEPPSYCLREIFSMAQLVLIGFNLWYKQNNKEHILIILFTDVLIDCTWFHDTDIQ